LRAVALGRTYALAAFIFLGLAAALVATPVAGAGTGGAGVPPPPPPGPTGGIGQAPPPITTPMPTAQLSRDGRTAIPPAAAPDAVKNAIYAANRIVGKPYRYGGGHRLGFKDRGYDCSGTVSYALNGGGLLRRPLDSSSFMRWGEAGPGQWITVYTNPGHAFVVIAGLRLDTSAAGDRAGGKGPRWRPVLRSTKRFKARHPIGL
jgi:cell wall-associated NlpC family hydrolase